MNKKEAEACVARDLVTAKNGPYTQIGVIVCKEPHDKGGFWITFEWWTHGIRNEATKRHQSVELREMSYMERLYSRGSHRDGNDKLCHGKFVQTDLYRQHMETTTVYTCIKCGEKRSHT